jgi:UDP-N-acetylmuramoylalanine--D-glutamate ligase
MRVGADDAVEMPDQVGCPCILDLVHVVPYREVFLEKVETSVQGSMKSFPLETTPAPQNLLGDVVVLGLGKSGLAATRYCLSLMSAKGSSVVPRVDSVTVYPGVVAPDPLLLDELSTAGAHIEKGSQEVSGEYDLAIVSPGIPRPSAFFRSALACSREAITEPELAWRESPDDWIAVTGTNGKTTTTSLIHHVLVACGIDARAVGNIGLACLDAVAERRPGQVLVAELSSFQLASTVRFEPRVAVLLNITPDHVEWHGTLEAYAEAKRRIVANLTPSDRAVVNADDPGAAEVLDLLEERGVPCTKLSSTSGPGKAACVNGVLGIDIDGTWTELGPEEGLRIKGSHNTVNALAAAAACGGFGIFPHRLYEALCSFAPIEHRIEPCGMVGGVAYYNDSKATNSDATIKALTAFGVHPLIVLLGGHDKMTDLTGLVEACSRRCKAVVCFGEARSRFSSAFASYAHEGRVQLLEAENLEDALSCAHLKAASGDVVVLSPACSSFDEFSSFEERGMVFKCLVASLPGYTR